MEQNATAMDCFINRYMQENNATALDFSNRPSVAPTQKLHNKDNGTKRHGV